MRRKLVPPSSSRPKPSGRIVARRTSIPKSSVPSSSIARIPLAKAEFPGDDVSDIFLPGDRPQKAEPDEERHDQPAADVPVVPEAPERRDQRDPDNGAGHQHHRPAAQSEWPTEHAHALVQRADLVDREEEQDPRECGPGPGDQLGAATFRHAGIMGMDSEHEQQNPGPPGRDIVLAGQLNARHDLRKEMRRCEPDADRKHEEGRYHELRPRTRVRERDGRDLPGQERRERRCGPETAWPTPDQPAFQIRWHSSTSYPSYRKREKS